MNTMDIRPELVRESIEVVGELKKVVNENTAAVLKTLLIEKNAADIAGSDTKEEPVIEKPSEGTKDTAPTETKEEKAPATPAASREQETDWSDVEQFKVGEKQYDLTNASDDDVVKVFKKLSMGDKLKVVEDGETVTFKDEETGGEYIVQLGTEKQEEGSTKTPTNENKQTKMQNEDKKLYEVALGDFTNKYQTKDAMTTPPNKETAKPGKSREMTAGLPTGSERPYGNKVPKAAPFTEGTEIPGMLEDGQEAPVEEAAQTVSTQPQAKATKSAMHRPGHRQVTKAASKEGEYKGTLTVTEEQMNKIGQIVEENKKLRATVTELQNLLKSSKQEIQEAVVANISTGFALRLIAENTTTEAEKKDIINRMMEAKTPAESKTLFETITRELKNAPSKQLAESIKADVDNKTMISESKEMQVKTSEELDRIKNLMHRVC